MNKKALVFSLLALVAAGAVVVVRRMAQDQDND